MGRLFYSTKDQLRDLNRERRKMINKGWFKTAAELADKIAKLKAAAKTAASS